ncbi:MAG: glutaredoxin family protein [Chloroflexi bacterium]|nr:glutaredoxin family protein [Chloroflexota bacterium]
MTPAPPVTLYTRADCPLCDEARALLDRLAANLGFTVEAVDIDADPELRSRYNYAVPVIAVGSEEIARAPVRAAALETSLRERYR